MHLAHLALTVLEDPDQKGHYFWLLLRSGADGGGSMQVSDESYEDAIAAFDAGTAHWRKAMSQPTDDLDLEPPLAH